MTSNKVSKYEAKPFFIKIRNSDKNVNYFTKDHFLFRLGEHFSAEIKLIQQENEESDKKSITEKIREGFLLQEVKVLSLNDGEIQVDISKAECNFSNANAIIITDLNTFAKYKGTVNSSDGEILSYESSFRPKIGSILKIDKHFSAFNQWMNSRLTHYNCFLRNEKVTQQVDQKLNCLADPTLFQISEVEDFGNLDKFQIKAFNKCIDPNPVTLIQGPPGTGKTTFAASLAIYLTNLGFDVMVTAFTHDAINNILEKILKLGGSVSKIGRKNKCTEKLDPFRSDNFSSYKETTSIVGMTIHSLLKTSKKFDFIIVDEASQMDIVSGVHFLGSSEKTIFIGDHMQLPNIPKITGTEFSMSIFDLLRENYASTPLLKTYRLNQSICNYISPNFYEGKLKCAESVKDKNFKFEEGKILLHPQLESVLSEEALIFIQTDEEVEFLLNKEHASITADLIESLLSLDVPKEEIGVIAPNNMQVNFIKKVLGARKIERKGIQIETVNKYQGQEKDVVIYNSVITKTDSEKAKYDFFFDVQRFNVAVSRARKKVIVLGNQDLFAISSSLTKDGQKIADYLNKAKVITLNPKTLEI